VLRLSTLGFGLLVAVGCSSSLDEYRCTTNSQCIADEEQGICHSSGYCAFVDFDECDGYRFGKLSGERSDLCVNGEGDAGPSEIDAGPDQIDASPDLVVPVAVIEPVTLGCGLTELVPDGRDSEAFDGASLVSFAWTLRSPNDTVIGTLSGPPDDPFSPTINFLTGDVDHPLLNITPYRGDHMLFVDTDGAGSAVFQENMTVPSGPYRLSFAAASGIGEDTAQGFQFLVGVAPDTTVVEDTVILTETMKTYTLDFDSAFGLQDAAVVFLTDSGEYFLDNVRLHSTASDGSDSSQLLFNPSFENALNGWDAELVDGMAHTEQAELPWYLAQYGTYEIELVVTDSEGLSSAPAKITVTHAACSNE
jgi:hypothetical protein